MSGPVYWLPQLEKYDQVLRFDDDSLFTRPFTRSLELQGNETYAYAIVSGDDEDCQRGFPEFMRNTYEGSPDVARWGSVAYSAPWIRNRNFFYIQLQF